MSWWEYVESVSGRATQAEIAKKANVEPSAVSRWKNGVQGARPESIAAFARAYDRPVLEAFIAAGFLTPDEAAATEISLPTDRSNMPTEQITAEIKRLVDELRKRTSHEGVRTE